MTLIGAASSTTRASRDVAVTRSPMSASLSSGRHTTGTRGRSDREDHVAGLLPGLDVPRGFDHVLERIRAFDHRAVLPRLDESLQEQHVLLRLPRDRERHALVAEPP